MDIQSVNIEHALKPAAVALLCLIDTDILSFVQLEFTIFSFVFGRDCRCL